MPDDNNSREPLGASISKLEITRVYDPKQLRSQRFNRILVWGIILIIIVSGFAIYFYSRTFQVGPPIPTRYILKPTYLANIFPSYQMPDNSFSVSIPKEFNKMQLSPDDSLIFYRSHNDVSSFFSISSIDNNSKNSPGSSFQRKLFSPDKLFRTYLRSRQANYSESNIKLNGQPAVEFYTGKMDTEIPYYAALQKINGKYYTIKLIINADAGATKKQIDEEISTDKKFFSQILASIKLLD